MVFRWLTTIAWSGIDRSVNSDTTPLRILNLLSSLLALVMILHLPIVVLFWSFTGSLVLMTNLIHILLFLSVYFLNSRGQFMLARGILMCGFNTYILSSSLLWKHDAQFHYFLLIGIFVSPFLYYCWESKRTAPNTLVYGLGFLFVDGYWQLHKGSENLATTNSDIIDIFSALFLLTASIISSQLIRENTQYRFQSVERRASRFEYLLDRALPHYVAKKLCDVKGTKSSETLVKQCHASVLFADIQGYTQFSQTLPTDSLVALLDELYHQFDQLTADCGLEKIKTNGDQYMCISGVLLDNPCYALDCCRCAVKMQDRFQKFCQRKDLPLNIRIGIASGEVYAGIIGKNSLTFDVWGNTVNLASHLESFGRSGSIQICARTKELVESRFICSERGKVQLKGLGKVVTFWLLGDKSCTN